MQKTYFISDLHLSESRPDISRAFFDFISTLDEQVDALYILGDFFEVWVGDDYETELSESVAAVLRQLKTKGIDVYFVHGNRDFLIGQRYANKAGMTLLPEQIVIDLYGTPTLLLHGDEMCTQDVEYQKFRKKSRGWWWPRLMLAMPLWYRRRVARKAREKSKISQAGKAPEILDVTEQAVLQMFEKHDIEHMIHGHTHRPDIHTYQHNGKHLQRTVLGDWYTQGSMLEVTENEQALLSRPFSQ